VVELNLPNFFTIGIISLAAFAAFKAGAKAIGIDTSAYL